MIEDVRAYNIKKNIPIYHNLFKNEHCGSDAFVAQQSKVNI